MPDSRLIFNSFFFFTASDASWALLGLIALLNAMEVHTTPVHTMESAKLMVPANASMGIVRLIAPVVSICLLCIFQVATYQKACFCWCPCMCATRVVQAFTWIYLVSKGLNLAQWDRAFVWPYGYNQEACMGDPSRHSPGMTHLWHIKYTLLLWCLWSQRVFAAAECPGGANNICYGRGSCNPQCGCDCRTGYRGGNCSLGIVHI